MKIGLGQIGTEVGGFAGNVAACAAAAHTAADAGAELVVLPELAVTGCPPGDLLLDDSFVDSALAATEDLAARVVGGPPVIVGSIARSGGSTRRHPGLLNTAVVLEGGRVRTVIGKRLLPAHDSWFEPRWFSPGAPSPPIDLSGRRIGILVGGDLGDDDPSEASFADPMETADAVVCLAASPFHRGVRNQRFRQARRCPVSIAYVNACGATDELIYDGHSFVLDSRGQVVAFLPGCAASVAVVDTEGPSVRVPEESLADLRDALVLGIRDFAVKNRLPRAFLGLSGGVDSALVACLAKEALGAERVSALAIPSRFSDPRSTESARELARGLGIAFEVVPLDELHAAGEKTLRRVFEGVPADATVGENLQARLRMVILMGYVNRFGGLLLNTTNKTESALGYGTLYGDTAGALCPIADLQKTEVLDLARFIGGIPGFILDRPPSAELRPDQVDPFDYAMVAPQVEAMLRAHRSDAALRRSEHKRHQMGVILRVSETAFGSGRLVPITRR